MEYDQLSRSSSSLRNLINKCSDSQERNYSIRLSQPNLLTQNSSQSSTLKSKLQSSLETERFREGLKSVERIEAAIDRVNTTQQEILCEMKSLNQNIIKLTNIESSRVEIQNCKYASSIRVQSPAMTDTDESIGFVNISEYFQSKKRIKYFRTPQRPDSITCNNRKIDETIDSDLLSDDNSISSQPLFMDSTYEELYETSFKRKCKTL